jgi:hypothetical protein
MYNTMTSITSLNPDTASHILKYLNTVAIVSMLNTSMSMLKTFDAPSVWLELCHHHHIKLRQKDRWWANSEDYKMFALQFPRFVIYGDLIKEHNHLKTLQRLARQLQQVPVPRNENDLLHLVTTKFHRHNRHDWIGEPRIGCDGAISSDSCNFDYKGRRLNVAVEFLCVMDESDFCWESMLGMRTNECGEYIARVPKRPERSSRTGRLEWSTVNIKTAEDRPIANSPPLSIHGAMYFLIGEHQTCCTLPSYNYVIDSKTVGTGRVVEMNDEAKKLRSVFRKSVKKYKRKRREERIGSGRRHRWDVGSIDSSVLLVVQTKEDKCESNHDDNNMYEYEEEQRMIGARACSMVSSLIGQFTGGQFTGGQFHWSMVLLIPLVLGIMLMWYT